MDELDSQEDRRKQITLIKKEPAVRQQADCQACSNEGRDRKRRKRNGKSYNTGYL